MLGVVGISHKIANVSVREMFTINNIQLQQFSHQVTLAAEIDEVYVQSTCNRTKVYFYKNCSCGNKAIRLIRENLHAFHNISNDFSDKFYHAKKGRKFARCTCHYSRKSIGISGMEANPYTIAN